MKIENSKNSNQENFPVGSFLLPKNLRPHIAAYYRFARDADDIADSSILLSDEKVELLDKMESVILGSQKACEQTNSAEFLKNSLEQTGVSPNHATDLLKAFRQDAIGFNYQIWDELIAYCRFSAAPVGRYLLDLHGELPDTHWCGDPLCIAFQILNHLQDCKKDFLNLNRIYFPSDFMKEYGVDANDFAKNQMNENMKKLFDKLIEGVSGLLKEAQTLPSIIKNTGLRMEVSVMLILAHKLNERLKVQDPFAVKVSLGRLDWISSSFCGILSGLFTKQRTLR